LLDKGDNHMILPTLSKKMYAFRLIAKGQRKSIIVNKCKITPKQYDWIHTQFVETEVKIIKPTEQTFSEEFLSFTKEYHKKSGCYVLYDKDMEIVYIGQSWSIGQRVVESADERKGVIYAKLIPSSMSDAFVLEMLLINTYKPKLNSQSKGWGTLSFTIPEAYNLDVFEHIEIYNQKKVDCLDE